MRSIKHMLLKRYTKTPKFSASGVKKCTVSVRNLHSSRKSQYLYFYGKPGDMSGVRTPTVLDLMPYTLFLFRVVDGNGACSSEPVVLDQGSLDKELSKGLLGWANKDPHRFAYGVQSELGENLLIVGDTTSVASLINGASRSFNDVSDDTFSGKYSLIPAAKSTHKITYSNQTFPNKFIGDLGFDFEVWAHKGGASVAREPLRSSDVNDSESLKKSMSGVLLQAFQKLAIAGVVGSVTTFGMSDIALAAGSYEDALRKWSSEMAELKKEEARLTSVTRWVNDQRHEYYAVSDAIAALEQSRPDPANFVKPDITAAAGDGQMQVWQQRMDALKARSTELTNRLANLTGRFGEVSEQLREATHKELTSVQNDMINWVEEMPEARDPGVTESKHGAPTSSEMKDDGKLRIPEEKASSPRELLRPQGDEKVDPNDSISVIPNEPDSPRQPEPIVEAPDRGAGAGPQQNNNQNPGDLSEILGNHEAAEGAADRADARVRAGINLWQYVMGHGGAEPSWTGWLFGDHPEINSWSQFLMGGGNNPSLGDYLLGSDNLSEGARETRTSIIWNSIKVIAVVAAAYVTYEHGYYALTKAYNWYYDVRLEPRVANGFLNRNELVDWLMERPYRDILKPHEQLWYDLFDPHHDVHLSNGWAGKAHMFEVFPTFGQAAEIAKFMPYALRSFLTTSFPLVAAVSKATSVSPIKIAVVGAGVAAQAAVLAAKTTTSQWLLSAATGFVSSITASAYQTTAWVTGLFTSGVAWVYSKLVKVTAVTLDSAMDWGIRVGEGVGLLTPEQAERLRQARANFNRAADSKLKEYWGYFKEAVGIAGPMLPNLSKGESKAPAPETVKEEPFPWDALILLSLIGLVAYLVYENMKRRTRSINEGGGRQDV